MRVPSLEEQMPHAVIACLGSSPFLGCWDSCSPTSSRAPSIS